MKKNDLASLRGKTNKELAKTLSEKKNELAKVVVGIFAGTEKNLKKGRNLRAEIAKIATIAREKEIFETMNKAKEVKNNEINKR